MYSRKYQVTLMEDVLEVYQRTYDPLHPVVCLDETSRQLIEETRPSLPPRPGDTKKVDHEYRRNGAKGIRMVQPEKCQEVNCKLAVYNSRCQN